MNRNANILGARSPLTAIMRERAEEKRLRVALRAMVGMNTEEMHAIFWVSRQFNSPEAMKIGLNSILTSGLIPPEYNRVLVDELIDNVIPEELIQNGFKDAASLWNVITGAAPTEEVDKLSKYMDVTSLLRLLENRVTPIDVIGERFGINLSFSGYKLPALLRAVLTPLIVYNIIDNQVKAGDILMTPAVTANEEKGLIEDGSSR